MDLQDQKLMSGRNRGPLKKRQHSGRTIDEEEQPTTLRLVSQKLRRLNSSNSCGDAVPVVVTPAQSPSERSSSPNTNILSFALPFFNTTDGGVETSSSSSTPTEDIKFKFQASQTQEGEGASSMDDAPVWDDMYNIGGSSGFATHQQAARSTISMLILDGMIQEPPLVTPFLATRKVTSVFDADADVKDEDLSDGIFGWFTDDVVQDVNPSKSTNVSLVSGDSSHKLNDDEELKPTVSLELEDQDIPSTSTLLDIMGNVMGDIDDVDIDLDGPVFEDNILDHTTLVSSTCIGAMFDKFMSSSPSHASVLSDNDNETICNPPSSHLLASLDPLPFSSSCVFMPTSEDLMASDVIPEKPDHKELRAVELLANVNVADASKELDETESFSDSSSENESLMTPHQKKAERSKGKAAWMKRFDQLREFARENGNYNVPQKYDKNPSLGRWVARQRLFMRQCLDTTSGDSPSSQMDIDERVKLLRTIGLKASPKKKGAGKALFISCRNTKEWDTRFAELLRYRSIHGDCDVPVKTYGNVKSLGRWVASQRKKYKEFKGGEFDGENPEQFLTRFRRLKEIGFKFKIGSGRGPGRASATSGSGSGNPQRLLESRYHEHRPITS